MRATCAVARKVIAMSPLFAALASAGAGGGCRSLEPPRRADLIITNAGVWTADPSQPKAEAIAVAGDCIVAVGTAAIVDAWRTPDTRVIDVRGRTVIPGFNDAHIHLMDGGRQLDDLDLKDAATAEEFARRIGERAAATPKGEWVLGGNWDEQGWTAPLLPTRSLIDKVTGDTPVFLGRYDLHMALANTAALRLAGVTAATPAPAGGEVVRDARGEPTGILKDAAMGLVSRIIPAPTRERRVRALKRALDHMASLGVTSVQDMGPAAEDVELYDELAAKGGLTVRIRVAPLLTSWAAARATGGLKPPSGPVVRSGAVKAFADGSLGSTTAFFFAPYTDAPGQFGLLADEMQPIDGMRSRLMEADKAGQQFCIHAIGDRANAMVLDLVGEVAAANGARDRRPRIEHAQHIAPSDIGRFARLGVIASVQPYHAIDDGRWAEKRIGPERAKTTYPFRSFLDAGVRLAIGTDWPVAPLSPMAGVYAAVTRATLDGKRPDGWIPEQKISVAEALQGYTLGAAYAEYTEGEKGSVTVGRLADLVVLSDDPFVAPPSSLRDIIVETTIVGGKVVYEK